jgi:hypothetical protein
MVVRVRRVACARENATPVSIWRIAQAQKRDPATLRWHARCTGGATVHELALMSDLIDVVCARRDPRRVLVVRLAVGARSGVAVEALRFSFDVCAEGTDLEAARLEIIETAGDELRLEEIEVSTCA